MAIGCQFIRNGKLQDQTKDSCIVADHISFFLLSGENECLSHLKKQDLDDWSDMDDNVVFPIQLYPANISMSIYNGANIFKMLRK